MKINVNIIIFLRTNKPHEFSDCNPLKGTKFVITIDTPFIAKQVWVYYMDVTYWFSGKGFLASI